MYTFYVEPSCRPLSYQSIENFGKVPSSSAVAILQSILVYLRSFLWCVTSVLASKCYHFLALLLGGKSSLHFFVGIVQVLSAEG